MLSPDTMLTFDGTSLAIGHLRRPQKRSQETMWTNAHIFLTDGETKTHKGRTLLFTSHT